MSDLNQILETARGSEGNEQSISTENEAPQVGAPESAGADAGGAREDAPDDSGGGEQASETPQLPEPPDRETIPLRRYLQEREKAYAANKRNEELAQEIDELRATLEEIQERSAPEYDDDPKAYVDRKLDKLQKDSQKKSQEPPQDYEAQILHQQIVQDAQRIQEQHPDFAEALDHVRSQLYHQHLLSGVPEQDITQTILNAETNLAKALFAQGRSPSEFVYNYATQHGYKPKSQTAKAAKQDASKIDDLKRGQEAASPMPSGDGVAPSGRDSRSHLSALDEAMSEAFGFMRKS